MDKISSLIERTVESIQVKVKCERAVKVQAAIATSIKEILTEVAKEEPNFKASELLQVGSYAEGTKIQEPDEFDFLVVIDELSKPGAIAINNDPEKVIGSTHLPNPGFATVVVADDKLKTKWEKVCVNGLLQCFQDAGHRGRFGHAVNKAIRRMYKELNSPKKTNTFITCSATEIDFLNTDFIISSVDDTSLFLRRAEFKTPNVLIEFELGGLAIGVDLSPAIRYHKIKDCFDVKDCASPKLAELVLQRESLLLVANQNCDFRVTVTEAEVQYIQSIMKHEHKVIYIFLKHINSSLSKRRPVYAPFTSYMLKNRCLMHDVKCQSHTRKIASCFENVIEDLAESCTDFTIPSAFNVKVNLCHLERSTKGDVEYSEFIIEALTRLFWQLEDIHSVEQLNDFLSGSFSQFINKSIDMIIGL